MSSTFDQGPAPDPRRRADSGLVEHYCAIRAATVALAGSLTLEDQVVQPCDEASPTKWHLGHTTWFFEKFVLAPHAERYRPADERYDRIFNSYYDTVGPQHPRAERGLLSRPTVAQIHDYRSRIDETMLELLASPRFDSKLAGLVELGLNHEEQHQELLLTDAKQVLFASPLAVRYRETAVPPRITTPAPLAYRERPAGFVELGAGEGFAFDNERPRHREFLNAFGLANRPVTNGEYRDFIRDGGYTTPSLWLADGWATVRRRGWTRPLCWAEDLELEYTLGGWQPIDPHAPVCHVSFYEAAAFAAWAGARLPSEAEWESVAASSLPIAGNFRESGHLHPVAVAAEPDASVMLQIWGDVWEWCASAYRPYPKFRPLEGSLGEYNGKFMCNQWVARGGSCVTPSGHVRPSYRNFFYPHDRWQFLGVRLARDS